MADYKPSAQTFDDWDEEFSPSSQHFDQWDEGVKANENGDDVNGLIKEQHPILYSGAEKIASHPKLASALQGVADSPGVEGMISAGPSFVNALGNIGNMFSEVLAGKKIIPKMQRPFPEPTDLRGKIGSKIGDIAGASTAFAASPISSSIPGGMATAFAEGEGGFFPRLADSLIGMILPGALHGKNILSQYGKKRAATKAVSDLELDKANVDKSIYESKEKLANQLNKDVMPAREEEKNLSQSLKNMAGTSDAVAKKSVADALKATEKDIDKKYKTLYEGFNNSKSGQSLVKEPVKIENLMEEYKLAPEDFSTESQKLINKLIGKTTSSPEGAIISPTTGQPLKSSSLELKQASNPKVAEYIDLWKQLRAEVADFRKSSKLADTPESKRIFREKANQLEKLSDDINKKAMESIPKHKQAEYMAIQKGYLNERVPFYEESLLTNATDKFPKVADNFFNQLNKSGVGGLINTIKSQYPNLVESITKHDIKDIHKLSVDKLNELINSDFGRFMPKNVRKVVNDLHLNKKAQNQLGKALSKIQSSEIARKVRSADIDDIIKSNPELATPFKNIEKEQKRLRMIKNELIDAGFAKKEAEKALKKYKKLGSLAKSLGVPVGAYAGVVKAKTGDFGSEVNEGY